MKNAPLTLLCALVMAGSVFGQAPTSMAGLTLRISYSPSLAALPSPNYVWESIDFASDGTYTAHFSFVYLGGNGAPIYNSPSSGTYTYNQTSSNTATLTGPSLPSAALTFSSSSQGTSSTPATFGMGPIPATPYPFSLLPTGGTSSTQALVNMSVLVNAKQGSPVSFGFVVGGTIQLREILIRAVGPSLAQFGVSNYTINPAYVLNNVFPPLPGEVRNGSNSIGWSATPASTATISAENIRAGAFSLVPGSNDKADVVLLNPGAYTITINPTDPSQEGTELIEIYEVE